MTPDQNKTIKRLCTAVENNDRSVARALLENGADPNGISDDDDCPFWLLQYAPDDPRDNRKRIEIAKLFMQHGADPNLTVDGESVYDYVMYKLFNETGDPDHDYLLKFLLLLAAYGGGGRHYPRPALSEPIDRDRADEYDIRPVQCEDGYHLTGRILDPRGKEIGTL